MREEKAVPTADIEGIRIERERKYVIPNEEIANLIQDNLPDQLLIPIPKKTSMLIDDNMLDLLNEIFTEDMRDLDGNFTLNVFRDEQGEKFIKKHRPNYYFDTSNDDLHNNNISFNLRQRESDWAVTVKLRTKEVVTKGVLKGIFERIEFTSVIDGNVIKQAKAGNSIDIHRLIANTPSLKDTYDLRINKFTEGRPLLVKNSFTIDSIRSLYPIGKEKGMFHVSVDRISIGDESKKLFEFEVEITFGPAKSWLDTVSMRVFDYLCTGIILAIKNKLKPLVSPNMGETLFTEVTHLSKVEREKNISAPQLIFASLEGEGHDFALVSQTIAQAFRSTLLKDLMPLMLCPYWISIPKAHGDVTPPPPEEEDFSFLSVSSQRAKRVKYSSDQIKQYRDNLWKLALGKIEDILLRVESDPKLIMEDYIFVKVLAFKLTTSNYLLLFLFPYQNYDHVHLVIQANTMLKKLFELTAKELGDEDIFNKVEVDCSVLLEELTLPDVEATRLLLENVQLFSVDMDNIDDFHELCYSMLKVSENKLQKLVKNRLLLRKRGDREPIILLSAQNQNRGNFLYSKLDTSIHFPVAVKTLPVMAKGT